MTVSWLPEARDDILRLYEFLVARDPKAARRAIRAMRFGAGRLLDTPEVGRPLSDGTGRRELFVPFGAGAYVLRYRVHADTVVVIRVWHIREAR